MNLEKHNSLRIKRLFLLIILIISSLSIFVSCSDSSSSSSVNLTNKYFQVGKSYFETMQEAIDSIPSSKALGAAETVTMIKDAKGAGAYIDKNIILDMGPYTYTVSDYPYSSQQNAVIVVSENVSEAIIRSKDCEKSFVVPSDNDRIKSVLRICAPVTLENIRIDFGKNNESVSLTVDNVISLVGPNAKVIVQGSSTITGKDRMTVLEMSKGAQLRIQDEGTKFSGNMVLEDASNFIVTSGNVEMNKTTISDAFTFSFSGRASVKSNDVNTIKAVRAHGGDGGIHCSSASIHDFSIVRIITPATATTKGKIIKICSICGQEEPKDTTLCNDGDHSWRPKTSRTDCLEEFVGPGECIKCGASIDATTFTSLDEHKWNDYEVTTPSTCTEEGEEKRTCSVCLQFTTRTVEPLGHDWEQNETRHDCTDDHDAVEFICKRCSTTETQYLTATDHEFDFENGDTWYDPEATCTEAGKLWVTCTNCLVSSYTSVPALGHEFDWSTSATDVEPTCTTTGSNFTTCTRCGTELTYTDIPALGHNFDWKNGEVFTSPSTCMVKGYKLTTCTHTGCNETSVTTLELDPDAHNFVWDNPGNLFTSPSTCTVKGYVMTTCTNGCKTARTSELNLDANNHAYRDTWSSDTEKHWHDCAYDASHARDSEGDHAWGTPEVQSPELDKKGRTTETCTVCGYVSASDIPALKAVVNEDLENELNTVVTYLLNDIYVDNNGRGNKSKLGTGNTYSVVQMREMFNNFAYYVNVAEISETYNNPVLTIAGTEYSASDTVKLSIGLDNYIEDKVFVIEDGFLKVAPMMLVYSKVDENSSFSLDSDEFDMGLSAGGNVESNSVKWQEGSVSTVEGPDSSGEYTLVAKDSLSDWYVEYELNGVDSADMLISRYTYTVNNTSSVLYGLSPACELSNGYGLWHYPFGYGNAISGLSFPSRGNLLIYVKDKGFAEVKMYFAKNN